MVTISNEHNRSRNMEATFRGNPKISFYPSCNGTTYMVYTKSRNMKVTFRKNLKTIVYRSCNGYYMY